MADATCIRGSGAVGPAALGGLGGFPPGGEAALENTTDNFSPSPESCGSQGVEPWRLLDYLRTESAHRRQRSCMLGTLLDVVTGRTDQKRVSLSGLMACGYRWCPICGPRIAHRMRDDLERVIRGWREGHGGEVLFGTFTLAHDRDDSLADLVEAIMTAWHAVTAGKGWVTDRRRHGVSYWVRVLECKCSTATGWHPHLHYLLFVDAPEDRPGTLPVDDLLRSMFRRYLGALQSMGREAQIAAQDLHVATGDDLDDLARYMAKEAMTTRRSAARDMAFELSNSEGKRRNSIGVVRHTPGDLLAAAADGDAWAAGKFREYETSMLGRRFVAWAKGLRDLFDVEAVTDLDVAQAPAEEVPIIFQARAASLRRLIGRRGKRQELVKRMLLDAGPEVVAWLREWGVDAVAGTFDRQGGPIHQDQREEPI